MYDRTSTLSNNSNDIIMIISNNSNEGLGCEHALVFVYGDALEIPEVMAQGTLTV